MPKQTARKIYRCTCRLYCKADPQTEGKIVGKTSYHRHAAQRQREANMTEEELTQMLEEENPDQQSLASEAESDPEWDTLPTRDADPDVPDLPSGFESVSALSSLPPAAPIVKDVDPRELDSVDERTAFNLDEEAGEEGVGVDTVPEQPRAKLGDLAAMQDIISQIRNYDFEEEKKQWTAAEFEAFMNTDLDKVCDWTSDWDFEDPQFLLSLKTYLTLSRKSSEETYKQMRQNIKACWPESTMLSFDQVKLRLKWISGILPLWFDMCVNSCMAFTAIYADRTHCACCGEPRYTVEIAADGTELRKPRRQFATIPVGPQLQALWRHPDTVEKLRYRVRRTAEILQEVQSGGIKDYNDILCGFEYLEHILNGQIKENDMTLIFSMDGAQLYRDKASDSWFGMMMLGDLAPELRHRREFVFPTFFIGGPNPPKLYDTFCFPTYAHLAACQRHGLPITTFDSTTRAARIHKSVPWLIFSTADTVGQADNTGWVGHHGRNGCRLLCPMPGRHKPGIGTYYPAMYRPDGDKIPPGSAHPDINPNSICSPSKEEYDANLAFVLASQSQTQYEARRKQTGLRKPTIISGLSHIFPVPKCFPADLMHLSAMNIGQLFIGLWRGTIEHHKDDKPSSWPFAVFRDASIWNAHGSAVAECSRHIPVCVESRTPRNPAEKISSGYKAAEYMVYLYSLCPALLYDLLPEDFYLHFCKLVYATRIIFQHHKTRNQLISAQKALVEFVVEYEKLYYGRRMERLHFVRPCIHALLHLVSEHFRIGSLTEVAQWTMERTIGNLGEELRQHSDPYANLTQRVIERARTNAVYAMAPHLSSLNQQPEETEASQRSYDLGSGYKLLGPVETHVMSEEHTEVLRKFVSLLPGNLRLSISNTFTIDQFARLLLPNIQTARAQWHEQKRPDAAVRRARNVKLYRLSGTVCLAEILYFFVLEKDGTKYGIAVVQLYSEADRALEAASYSTLHVHTARGTEGTAMVDVRSIIEVVGMVPFKSARRNRENEYFLVESISLTQQGDKFSQERNLDILE